MAVGRSAAARPSARVLLSTDFTNLHCFRPLSTGAAVRLDFTLEQGAE
jgi:hypothetical protein